MSSDNEKSRPSRLSQRSLGVSNRVWLIILLFLAVLGITHYLSPSSQTQDFKPYSTVDLKSINYLNGTEKPPNPFEFCPSYGPMDRLGTKYGPSVLSQSRLHLGSGARIHRVLNRALNGHPVTISVLGSSISACHGAGDDPISPKCYPSKFFKWWNSVFPHPATELTNGAMRRTNSGYFGFCNAHHLPDVTDLVIIELDTEDSPDQDMMENFEILIRSILIRPDQPAVLLLGHFSPQIHTQYGFAGPDHHHNAVAQFYDVPHVSIKSAVYPEYIRDPNSVSKFFVDPVLSSPLGHDLITDILVAYFQDQICTVWGVATGQIYSADAAEAIGNPAGGGGIFGGVGQRKGVPEEHRDTGDGLDANENRIKPEPKDSVNSNPLLQAQLRVPAGRINTRPNSGHPFEEIAPYCVSANDLINPLPPSLFYGSGWHAFHPSTASGSGAENALKTTAHYWYSTLPTSKLRIPIQVGAGDIGVYYLREPVSVIGEGSAVECWVDDNYAGARVIENAANIGEPVAALEVIDHYVSRGSHFVECQLMGEEGQGVPPFKIVGVFST
ncbi:CAP64-like protein [Pluteus cervinus]|uniref:CAP64-like protein n=1 Tax=Pluteus cervinus TaxID=181527 RepID=A0ACD3ASC6_9AGAR|nr:CAP64-like protein [Pluteus cervinus]